MATPRPDLSVKEHTIGEIYGYAVEVTDPTEATAFFTELVAHMVRFHDLSQEKAEQVVRSNIGYVAGYYSSETAQRCNQLYNAVHPIFGTNIPSASEAFQAGVKLATPAPVAPTSADVLTVPSGHNPAWQPDLDEEWLAILARLPAIRAYKHDLLLAVSGDNWDRVDDLFAIVRGQEDIIKGLRASTAALQAKLDTLTRFNPANANDLRQMVTGEDFSHDGDSEIDEEFAPVRPLRFKIGESVEISNPRPDFSRFKGQWGIVREFNFHHRDYKVRVGGEWFLDFDDCELSPFPPQDAPNGGEAAAMPKQWPIILHNGVTHAVLATGGPADGSLYGMFTFCNLEVLDNQEDPNWREIKNGQVTCEICKIGIAHEQKENKRLEREVHEHVANYIAKNADALSDLKTTPAQPVTARKLSSVKLTAAQVKALQRIDAEFLTFHNINKQTRKALVKQALIDVYWSTEFEATLLRLTDLGRAALAARESEAGK